MIRHVVLLKFRRDVTPQRIDGLLAEVAALKDKIGGILSVSGGANNSPEGLEKGFAHGFVVDFADAAARDAYLPHPEHVKVGGRLVDAAEGGLDGILVFDYAV